ncbi:MAG: 2-oxoacid:acceptor oxidoreductase family protein [Candidatus Coatesbacteria bacterium]|nr:2-oxoacid:acceptor oxidoreductase family protein [Candidatus Coatesbacteria bacterium]
MNIFLRKPKGFYDVYLRSPASDKTNTHYCPGCGHGIIHKLIAQAIEDFDIKDRTIMISPVGCSVFVYYYFDTGNVQVAHGRAPAVATGLKRANPDSIVISYQGDGDLAAIGGNNIMQAANRGENITVFFVNNAIYGMTGGQMAPTTMIGQKTMTSPYGRNIYNEGYPLKVVELLATFEATTYLERVSIMDAASINKARNAVRKAIQCQIDNKGFSLVEILSTCPSNWKMSPVEAKKWIKTDMITYFTPHVTKDKINERESHKVEKIRLNSEETKSKLDLPEKRDLVKIDMSSVKEKYKNPRIKIAGFGGQGVLILGNMLAIAGMEEGFNVTWLPSYGPEMRGGTANCHVRIDEKPIGAPSVAKADVLIAMNKPSLEKFEKEEYLESGALLIYNTTLIDIEPSRKDVDIIAIPATKMADDMGDLKVANMIIIGAYMEKTKLINEEALERALQTGVKRKNLMDLNKKAIKAGMDFVKNLK